MFRGDADVEEGDGVGDDVHSWAYDGCRHKKWNGSDAPYGALGGQDGDGAAAPAPWRAGDVVGCLLELSAAGARMAFTLNGASLGDAFTAQDTAAALKGKGKDKDKAAGLYPALSLEENEAVLVNIGQRPFMHPPPAPREGAAAEAGAGAYSPVLHALDDDVRRLVVLEEGGAAVGAGPAEVEGTRGAAAAPAAPAAPAAALPEIALDAVSGVEALEALGLTHLKAELERRGLKAGGSLQERASRLWSVKGVAPADIPAKVKAPAVKK